MRAKIIGRWSLEVHFPREQRLFVQCGHSSGRDSRWTAKQTQSMAACSWQHAAVARKLPGDIFPGSKHVERLTSFSNCTHPWT